MASVSMSLRLAASSAAAIVVRNGFLRPNLLGLYGVAVRHIVTKSPGMSQKHRNRLPKLRRLLVNPGEFVGEKTVLANQLHFRYHPGYNVGIDPRDRSLYSIVPGKVYYSIERFYPDTKNHFVKNYYTTFLQTMTQPLYKKYIHVIPEKLKPQFTLIDLV